MRVFLSIYNYYLQKFAEIVTPFTTVVTVILNSETDFIQLYITLNRIILTI